ncbi:MAG TPA: aldo/keto reductase [Dehalococcoidia bacterium]|nr:aldo/keto reductase [Dehalococcoidia bacterium]
MEQRDLGLTGLRVSALGYGCGAVGGLMVRGDPDEQRRAVARAIEAGINYFDTAPLYGNGRSEENLGRVLGELGAGDRVVIGTKVRLSRDDLAAPLAAVRRSIEQSLRRLGRDHVDLLQLHNPVIEREPGPEDGDALSLATARGPVAAGLKEAVRAGLARHAGFTGLGEVAALSQLPAAGLETVQSYFNLLNPSSAYAGASGGGQDFTGLLESCAGAGLGVIAIRVLAAGALGGTAERPANAGSPGGSLARGSDYATDLARAQALQPLALQSGCEGVPELALRFALTQPGISTALVGYSDFGQLEDALRWAERGALPAAAMDRILALARGQQV